MNPTAAKGFHTEAEAYEKGRPEYSREIISFLQKELFLGSDKKLVDLAAGTGKFTRLIAATGVDLVAIEPVEGMRTQFRKKLPSIPVVEGSAENIPLPAASVDVVTVAQAFHWFSNEKALQEIHRVLKPQGHLVLIWNQRDEQVDWIRQMSEIINAKAGTTPQYRSGLWKKAFETTSYFSPLKKTLFRYTQTATIETLVDRAASTSFIGAMGSQEKETVLQALREMALNHPLLRGKDSFEFPHTTDVYVTQKLGS